VSMERVSIGKEIHPGVAHDGTLGREGMNVLLLHRRFTDRGLIDFLCFGASIPVRSGQGPPWAIVNLKPSGEWQSAMNFRNDRVNRPRQCPCSSAAKCCQIWLARAISRRRNMVDDAPQTLLLGFGRRLSRAYGTRGVGRRDVQPAGKGPQSGSRTGGARKRWKSPPMTTKGARNHLGASFAAPHIRGKVCSPGDRTWRHR